MKRTLILSTVAILLTAISLGYFFWLRPVQIEQKVLAKKEETKEKKIAENLISAPGVIEPISEELEVGTEIAGKLKQVLVEEGDQVLKGQTIAVLENADFQANIISAKTQIETMRSQKATAEAKLLQAKTDRERIENGARREERQEAKANLVNNLTQIF